MKTHFYLWVTVYRRRSCSLGLTAITSEHETLEKHFSQQTSNFEVVAHTKLSDPQSYRTCRMSEAGLISNTTCKATQLSHSSKEPVRLISLISTSQVEVQHKQSRNPN